MSAEFDALTREVQETKDKVGTAVAALVAQRAQNDALKAQVDAMKDAPTPAQLAALSAILDQSQQDIDAALAQVGQPTPEPPQNAMGETDGPANNG